MRTRVKSTPLALGLTPSEKLYTCIYILVAPKPHHSSTYQEENQVKALVHPSTNPYNTYRCKYRYRLIGEHMFVFLADNYS